MKEKKKFTALKIILGAIILAALFFLTLNDFYIDFLWFKEVGYLQVFFKELLTKLEIGLPVFLVLMVVFSLYFKLLSRLGGKHEIKGKFVGKTLPYLLALGIALVSSMIISSSLWDKWLIFINSVDFGSVDPVFGKDISFYMFKLPFVNSLVYTGMGLFALLVVITVVYSAVVISTNSDPAYSYEGTSFTQTDLKGKLSKIVSNFRVQISIFGAIFLVLAGVSFYLKRFALVYSANGVTYGASYTDMHVTYPYLTAMCAICAILAVCLIIFGITKKFKPIIYAGVLAAIVVVGGKGAEIVVQNYIVEPNEYAKESEYIGYTIQNTLNAYDLNDVDIVPFEVDLAITADSLEENVATVSNIPINDYSPSLDTYNSLQSIRTYYKFNDIDIDRYYIDGAYRQVFISAREMNTVNLVESAKSWINVHLKYTHGFGIVASPVNEVNQSGQPVLIAKDIPTQSEYESLSVEQARIYFSEKSDDYAVVNTKSGEFDYPSGTDNTVNTYDGTAGIKLTLLNRICFAIKEQTTKFLFSTDITGESVILTRRNIIERVQALAPYLEYDADPYIVTADGKLYWIIDAMTVSDAYPYSDPYTVNEKQINYIRNSVKVVIDAYNGDVTFYMVNKEDPIIQVYSKIFDNMYKDFSEMPASIRAHVRYSEAFFNVQAKVYSRYHMTNTNTFYNQEDVWEVATQLYGTSSESVSVNASYLIMDLPNRNGEEFMLMIPFTPRDKDNMTAWMTGLCDGEDYGKLIIYQFSKQSLVYGPMQMEQRVDQNPDIASQLTLLSQQGSNVIRGNMLTIPVNNSILYVEAVYVKASSGDNNLPEMKKVIVCFEDNIVMEDSLDSALKAIFGSSTAENNSDDNPDNDTIVGESTLSQLSLRASNLYNSALTAQKDGDWAAYGEYIKELGKVLDQIQILTAGSEGANTVAPEVLPNTTNEGTGDEGTGTVL